MDMQGTPIGSTNQGMKNTTDPAASNPINESTGPVASDSLAAESHKAGGGFSENKDSAPSATSGSSSTWNNTDTQGATKLEPASDAASREAAGGESATSGTGSHGSSGIKYPEAGGGQGPASTLASGSTGSGNTSLGDSTGSSTSVTGDSGGSTGGSSGSTGGSSAPDYGTGQTTSANTGAYSSSGADTYDSSNASNAPSYTLNQQSGSAPNQGKPKGDNIKEVSDLEGEQAKLDVDSSDDPARLATQGFANASASASGATGGAQMGKPGNEQPFGAIGGDTSA